MVATDVERLAVLIEANTKSYERAMLRIERRTNAAVNKSSKSVRRLDKSIKAVSATAGRFAKGFVGAFGADVIARSIGRVASKLSEIIDVADKVGVTTDQLQELRFAADQNGIAASQLDVALQRFSRRIGEAAEGTGELSKIVKDNNIQLRDTSGKMRPLIDIFRDYADVVSKADSQQKQLQLSFKAFDTEGAQLVLILRKGAIGVDELRRRAQELGIVIKRDFLQRAKELEDQIKITGAVMASAFDEFVVAAAPAVTDALRLITAGIQQLRKDNEQLKSELKAIADAFSPTVSDKVETLRARVDDLEASIESANKNAFEKGSQKVKEWRVELEAARKELTEMIDLAREARDISFGFEDARGNRFGQLIGSGISLAREIEPREEVNEASGNIRSGRGPSARERVIEALKFEADQLGLTSEQQRINNELRAAGVTLNSKQGQEIARLVTQIEQQREALASLADVGNIVASSLEDAFDQFLDTGKIDFKSFVDSAIKDLLRLQFQINVIKPLLSSFGGGGVPGSGGGGFNLGSLFRFAGGGSVRIGGRGGIDRNLLSLNNRPIAMVSRGETVNVNRSGQGGGTDVVVNNFGNDQAGATVRRGPTGRELVEVVIGDPAFARAVNKQIRGGTASPRSR